MFSYRRKIRASTTITVWGGCTPSGAGHGVGSGILCMQVEEIGEPLLLSIHERWLVLFSRIREVGLDAGEVYSIDLSSVRRVTARSSRGGDTFLNCALLPN